MFAPLVPGSLQVDRDRNGTRLTFTAPIRYKDRSAGYVAASTDAKATMRPLLADAGDGGHVRRTAVVDQDDLVAGQRKLVPPAGAGAVDRALVGCFALLRSSRNLAISKSKALTFWCWPNAARWPRCVLSRAIREVMSPDIRSSG